MPRTRIVGEPSKEKRQRLCETTGCYLRGTEKRRMLDAKTGKASYLSFCPVCADKWDDQRAMEAFGKRQAVVAKPA